MLSAIKRIGEFVAENQGEIRLVSTKPKKGDEYAVLIHLNKNEPSGFKVEIEDFNIDKSQKYLWDEDAKKGNNPLPFCKITEPAKTFEKKILIWYREFLKSSDDQETKVLKTLSEKKAEIIESIEQTYKWAYKESKSKVKIFYLGVKIEGKYPGEFESIREYWQESREVKDWTLGKCSVCGESKDVTARTGVFQFDTDDKPGFIVGGFNKKYSWRNIPVCGDCRENLLRGRKFIENKLSYKFYGLSYWLVPKFFIGHKNLVNEVLTTLSDRSVVKKISLKNLKDALLVEEEISELVEAKRSLFDNESSANDLIESLFKETLLTNDENESFGYLKEMQDSLGLNLLFIRKDQSAERILLLIEDVLPSRLNLIYNAKLKVEKNFKDYLFAPFSEAEKKEEKKNIWENYHKSFNFGKIRTFFSKSNEDKRDTDLDKYFLEVTEAVFKGKTIDWNFLTRFFMNSISSAFVKEEYFRFRVTDAMMVNNFLEELGLINYSKEEQMEASTFEEIFERYGKSLNTPSKRGIFLLGALTQMLLNLQYHLRSSAPFMKKLKSLKMNEQDIRGLLAEVQNKFIEYDRYDVGKRELAKEISDLFLQSGEDWKLSIDEMNYYFACGMNLYEKISEIIYSNLKQKEE